jgi:hypothetical protein
LTAEIDSLVLEHLRAIRATQADHGEQLASLRVEVSAIGQQLGALTTAVYSGKSDMDALKRRIERIEKRLELTD